MKELLKKVANMSKGAGLTLIIGGFLAAWIVKSFGGILGNIGGWVALGTCVVVMIIGVIGVLNGNGTNVPKKEEEVQNDNTEQN